MNRETYDEFIKARDAGKLQSAADLWTNIPRFIENELITDPTSREGEQFQSYMHGLSEQLLKRETWRPNAPVHYLLSNSDQQNAYVIPNDKINILVLSKGLLKFLKNKDELAFIVGHELGHIRIRDKLGTTRVTKGEEAAADVMQIPWLHQAGLNPLAGANVMARFWKQHENSKRRHGYDPDVLLALVDEHPNAALRPTTISNAVQGYARAKGITAGFDPKENEDFALKPKDKQLSEIAKKAKPASYFAKLSHEANYAKMSATQQLEFIRDHVDDVEEGFLPETRAQGILELLEACECNGRNIEHQALGKEILTRLVERPDAFNKCYGTVVINTLDQDDSIPVEQLGHVSDAMNRVINASSKEDLKQATTVLMQFIDTHPKLALQSLEWPAFELPTNQQILDPRNYSGVPLPWNKHIEWANELAQTGDSNAQRALFRMGVEDKRLFDSMEYEALREVVEGYQDLRYPAVSIRGEAIQPKSGAHPLILSAPSGKNRLSSLHIDFEKGKIMNVLWGAGVMMGDSMKAQHKWGPADYIDEQYKRALDAYLAKEVEHIGERSVDRWPTERVVKDFKGWIAANILALGEPDRKERKGPSDLLEEMEELPDLSDWKEKSDKQIQEKQNLRSAKLDKLKLNYEQLVEGIKDALGTGDERVKKDIRDFFFEDGKYSLTHVLSTNPDHYAWNVDNKKSHENDAFKSPYISIEYPIIKFALEDKTGLFTDEDRFKVATQFSGLQQDINWYQTQFFQNSDDTLDSALKNLRKLDKFFKIAEDMRAGRYEGIKRAAEPYIAIIKNHIPQLGARLAALVKHAPQLTNSALQGDTTPSESVKDLITELEETLPDETKWPESAAELALLYKIGESQNFITKQSQYKQLTTGIIKRLKDASSTEERLSGAQNLLLDGAVVNPTLRDAAIENWSEAILESLQSRNLGQNGLDDGTPAYADALKSYIGTLKERVPTALGMQMLATLADKLETQRELSFEMEKTFSITRADLERTDGQLKALEALMIVFARDKTNRFELINFLTASRSDDNIKKFGRAIRQHLKDEMSLFMAAHMKVEDEHSAYDIDADVTEKEYYRIKAEQLYDSYWRLPLVARAAVMDQLLVPAEVRFHEDLSLTEDEQAASLKGDYAAQHQKMKSQKYEREAFSYVLRKAFPDNMKYSEEAQDFLRLYSDVIPRPQKNLLFAVILSVDRASEGKSEHEFGIGKRLSMILDMMGPAERKLGQGINSHPSVPADLRYDARELKFKASPLTRWDAWHEIERTVHPDYRSNVKRLGKALGSASFYVTYAIEREDGSKGALRMLRDNALPQAKEGFRLLQKFVERHRTEHPKSSELCEVMGDLIEQAQSMAYTETNSEVGLAQMQHAQDLYNGFKIKADGHTFHFKTADWRAYGPEFMDQEYQPGTHFIELPGDDAAKHIDNQTKQQDFAYKKAAAKAYIAMEFINILSGQSFDHDRHGAQLRIDRINDHESGMGLFDNGAVHAQVYKKDGALAEPYIPGREKEDDYHKALSEGGSIKVPAPEKEEKVLLAKTLFKAVQDYLDPAVKRPIADTLYDEVRRIRKDTGKTPDYLLRVQRALLSLNDFFGFEKVNGDGHSQARYINDDDIADILTGIVMARDARGQKLIDPEIERAAFGGKMKQIGTKLAAIGSKLVGGGISEQLERFKSSNPIEIERDREIQYQSPDFYAAPSDDIQSSAVNGHFSPDFDDNIVNLRHWGRDMSVPNNADIPSVGNA